MRMRETLRQDHTAIPKKTDLRYDGEPYESYGSLRVNSTG